MWRRFNFKKCGAISFLSQFVNIFLVNGKMFSGNGKPFLIIFYICILWILKYAWCIFKATQVRVYKLSIKTTNQMLKHITITLK